MSEILKRIFGNTPPNENDDGGLAVLERPPELAPTKDDAPAKPPMYAVMLHNDESTMFDFVCRVLEAIFAVDKQEARKIMMKAHNGGKAVVRIYSREVAEERVAQAMAMASEVGHNGLDPSAPTQLTFTAEPESDGEC